MLPNIIEYTKAFKPTLNLIDILVLSAIYAVFWWISTYIEPRVKKEAELKAQIKKEEYDRIVSEVRKIADDVLDTTIKLKGSDFEMGDPNDFYPYKLDTWDVFARYSYLVEKYDEQFALDIMRILHLPVVYGVDKHNAEKRSDVRDDKYLYEQKQKMRETAERLIDKCKNYHNNPYALYERGTNPSSKWRGVV